MNGSRLLVDTNIALYLLAGDDTVREVLSGNHIFISFITELELLGYAGFTSKQLSKVESFLEDVVIIELNEGIKKEVIGIRQAHKMKLPDAIIAGTAKYMDIPLFSADKGFEKVDELNFLQYELE
ncbi:MAG: type II toxin-antitoxin system VapC family toxin [Bacteroidota bacterium]